MLIVVCRTIVSNFYILGRRMEKKRKEKILIDFGNLVRAQRVKKGLSQEKLAEKAGLHRTYIGMVERGEKNITLVNIHKIAQALDISVAELSRGLK